MGNGKEGYIISPGLKGNGQSTLYNKIDPLLVNLRQSVFRNLGYVKFVQHHLEVVTRFEVLTSTQSSLTLSDTVMNVLFYSCLSVSNTVHHNFFTSIYLIVKASMTCV